MTVDTQGFANVTVVAPDPWFDVTRAVGTSYIITLNASAYRVENWTQKSAGDRLDFKVEQSGAAGFLKIFVKDVE